MDNYTSFIAAVDADDVIRALELSGLYTETEDQLEAFYREAIFGVMKAVDVFDDPENAIWREHSRSELIKLVIDNLRICVETFYLKNRKGRAPVVLTCPEGELHEIGAKVVCDLLRIKGFNARFLGPNMPTDQVISFVDILKPFAVLFSVTNYYNLLSLRKVVVKLKDRFPEILLIAGGEPTRRNPEACPEAQIINDLDQLFERLGGELR